MPTVTIGSNSLVNPNIERLLALAVELAPHAVPDDYDPPQLGRLGRWIHAKLSGTL